MRSPEAPLRVSGSLTYLRIWYSITDNQSQTSERASGFERRELAPEETDSMVLDTDGASEVTGGMRKAQAVPGVEIP